MQPPLGPGAAGRHRVPKKRAQQEPCRLGSRSCTAPTSTDSKHRAPCRVGWGHGHVSLHPPNAPSAARWVMSSTRIARSTTANKHKVGKADGMVTHGRPHLTLRVFWPRPSTAAGSPRPRTRWHLAMHSVPSKRRSEHVNACDCQEFEGRSSAVTYKLIVPSAN